MLQEISGYLYTKQVGVPGKNMFLGTKPDKPDNCIILFEYAGTPPDLHWEGEYPGLQVWVRNTEYGEGREVIGDISNLLHGLHETTLGNTRFLLIRARGSPEMLGMDESDRYEFVLNFEIIKEV